MVLNIGTLFVSVALMLGALLLTLWKRPRLPLMTLILILELVFYLLCSNTVNNCISPTGGGMLGQGGNGFLLGLILGGNEHSIKLFELAFGNLQTIVLGLLVATIVCISIESYVIIIRPIQRNSDNQFKNKER